MYFIVSFPEEEFAASFKHWFIDLLGSFAAWGPLLLDGEQTSQLFQFGQPSRGLRRFSNANSDLFLPANQKPLAIAVPGHP